MGTFRRLLGFLDPYRRKLIVSLVPAWLAMAMTVAIPTLIGETVDAIENGDRDSLAAAIGAAGPLRLVLTLSRRLVAAGEVSLGVEYDCGSAFTPTCSGSLRRGVSIDLRSDLA